LENTNKNKNSSVCNTPIKKDKRRKSDDFKFDSGIKDKNGNLDDFLDQLNNEELEAINLVIAEMEEEEKQSKKLNQNKFINVKEKNKFINNTEVKVCNLFFI